MPIACFVMKNKKAPSQWTKRRVRANQAFLGRPTSAWLESFVFAEFFPKTVKATFGNSA
jgi:hypothetical protein